MNLPSKISILVLALSASAHAAYLHPSRYPAEFLFQNRPINPVCFTNLASNNKQINLLNCQNKHTELSKNENLINDGFYGFNFKEGSYSYYKVWEAGARQYWLYTVNGGGGSGEFTSISLFARENVDNVSLKTIAGGDRCNGGISDITEDNNNAIRYSVNLTAYDFLVVAADNPHHIKAYDGLAACAACCAAKAYYVVDKRLRPQLAYVDLGKNHRTEEMSSQGSYQACFNKIFSSFVASGKNKLDEMDLKRFVKEFNDTCVEKLLRK